MIINLLELPQEGRRYKLNRETGELNEALRDLINERPYLAEFKITPRQGYYQISGHFKCSLPELCSRCATDFEMSVESAFDEILVIVPKQQRVEKVSRTNHLSDLFNEDVESTELHTPQLDAGEFFHERIALQEPFQPLCQSGCLGICVCGANLNSEVCRCVEEGDSTSKDTSAFAALKDLKLKH